MLLLNMKFVEPIERTLNSKFKFRCHKGISCFNKCCKLTDILLTPYDILRMKKRLGISSEEFLRKYTYTHIDEKSSHPYAVLKMMDDDEGKCPFVTPEGCSIYEDRPANCRYYPVGQGLMIKGSEKGPVNGALRSSATINKEFYFFIREPNCLGFQEDKEWTIETWRIDQGVDLYDEMNSEWKEIQLRRDTPGQPKLDSKKQSMLYMASYDIDRFRRFIFESKFLDILDIDKEEVKKIKADEIALMKFGFKYLKYILMLEETLKVHPVRKDGAF
ncbi:MAG: YkgJ family cysteine cluster protein [Thermodesulfovibrionales bacterium]|nr:YkgJ family cysteine cluster protein [Thermodesulfovibrionales bacterium]